MPIYCARTTLADRDAADALSAAMERLEPEPDGIDVSELADGSGCWEVGCYFTEPPDEAGLALLATAFGAQPIAVSELPDTDWVAKVRRDLAPVVAGRFFVHGGHDADKVPADAVALLIEAALAFGTGHHGTTQGCLLALEDLVDRGVRARAVIDVGCGTAVLAMAAARVWDDPVLATDIDPVAIEVAEANVLANRLAGRVVCVVADGMEHPQIVSAAPFDLIFANILKGPLVALAPAMGAAAAPGGHAILSGLLNEQADGVASAYASAGFVETARRQIGDWTTLTLRRRG